MIRHHVPGAVLGAIAAPIWLAACASAPSTTTSADAVAKVQAAYSIAEALVNLQLAQGTIPAAAAAKIREGEAVSDPIVAALSATSAPATVAADLQDAQALAVALPAGGATAEVEGALAVARASLAAWQAGAG